MRPRSFWQSVELIAGGDAGQEVAGAGVAIGEGLAELTSEDEVLGQFAEFAEGHLVLDVIREEGPWAVGSILRSYSVAVVPVGEWAAHQAVAEAMVPDEVGDLRFPRDTNGREGDGPEGEGHASSHARSDASARWVCGAAGRWRREGGIFDSGLLPWGHKGGKIFRVGEEVEDKFDGVGEPLLRVKDVAHCGMGAL